MLCSGALLAVPSSAHAQTTYYVSPSGDDNASGTSADDAWRTPARAGAIDLAPGDRILFEGGQRFAGGLRLDAADAGTAEAPVVLGAYGGGRATLAPREGPGLFARDAGGLVIRDLVLEGPGADVSDSDGLAVYASSGWGRRLPAVRVARVEASGFGRWGLAIGSWAGPSGFDGIEIVGADAHDNALGGILTYAQQRAVHRSVLIRDSRAWSNPGRPGLQRNSGNGIVMGGVDGGRVEGCVAHHNGGRNDAHEGGVGIWAYDSHRVVIQGNESYGNRTGGPSDGGGFGLDDRVSDSVLQYNRSADNDGAGLLVANPSRDPVHAGNVIRFNLSERDGARNGYAGIVLWRRTSRLEVHHNTVVGPAAAVRVDELGDGSAALRNNVLMRTTAGPAVTAAADATAAVFQGNAYWSDGGPLLDWAGRRLAALPEWRAIAGQERVGGADTGIDEHPRLPAAGVEGPGRYAPAAGSPLIDAALGLAPFGVSAGERDLLGRSLAGDDRLDVGALQSGTVAAQPEPAPPGRQGEREEPAETPDRSPSAAAPAGAGGPAKGLGTVPAAESPRRRAASPRLRIDRVVRRRHHVRVVGRTARTLPAGAIVRVRVHRRGAAGPAVRVRVRRGRFAVLARPPARSRSRAIRVRASYAGDRAHRPQRRSVWVRR